MIIFNAKRIMLTMCLMSLHDNNQMDTDFLDVWFYVLASIPVHFNTSAKRYFKCHYDTLVSSTTSVFVSPQCKH